MASVEPSSLATSRQSRWLWAAIVASCSPQEARPVAGAHQDGDMRRLRPWVRAGLPRLVGSRRAGCRKAAGPATRPAAPGRRPGRAAAGSGKRMYPIPDPRPNGHEIRRLREPALSGASRPEPRHRGHRAEQGPSSSNGSPITAASARAASSSPTTAAPRRSGGDPCAALAAPGSCGSRARSASRLASGCRSWPPCGVFLASAARPFWIAFMTQTNTLQAPPGASPAPDPRRPEAGRRPGGDHRLRGRSTARSRQTTATVRLRRTAIPGSA